MQIKIVLLFLYLIVFSFSLKVTQEQEQQQKQGQEEQQEQEQEQQEDQKDLLSGSRKITVKFTKNDIQDNRHCMRKHNHNCIVKICPQTHVMKASYDCYRISWDELKTQIKDYKNSDRKTYRIDLKCSLHKNINHNPHEGARPDGGFNNKEYSCKLD